MRDINRVALTGRLTRDPELRATAAGTDVLSFGLAVNDQRKNQQTGQWEDVANFVDCAMFGKRAASLHPLLAKGMQVALEGSLRYSSWDAQGGSRRSKLSVLVGELVLPPRGVQGAQDAPQMPPAEDVYGEEIPF